MIVETFLRNEYQPELVTQLDHSYDIRQIRSEVGHILRLERKLEACAGRQLMLAVVPGAQNQDHHGCGTATDPFAENSSVPSSTFTQFNPRFKGYFLETIWKTFPYRIGRMTLLVLNRNSCLSLTTHSKNRLVYAVQTSVNTLYLYEHSSSWHHIPADEHLYYVNAGKRHTIYNGSEDLAVHIVFELLDQ